MENIVKVTGLDKAEVELILEKKMNAEFWSSPPPLRVNSISKVDVIMKDLTPKYMTPKYTCW